MIIANVFPVIETKNLILRKMTIEDKHDIFQMRKDSIMHEYTDSKPDESIEETETYIDKMLNGIAENKWIIWAIEHKLSKKVIGTISIWNIDKEKRLAELGYGVIPVFQGKGLMKEALLGAVDYGFNAMKLKSLDAYTEENNISSNKLLENCKFKIIDKVEDQGYCNDRIYHMLMYRLENTIQ
ncbi:GNAT family N-acetyltransferase [Alkaliphilus serpentinus]|uniref:GNAT family N-acetyltransferase n=1 Tax=Alkaliphilus serpentinus TaxID=1482731 RepID=A0A833MDS1_9FIRM|nr:GNAT family N-acetyltransferase [Alkaliphilus serpentinus]KAB3529390.1 GNAT family N-acetyltransferase [Alkaliphilus serpentinus]